MASLLLVVKHWQQDQQFAVQQARIAQETAATPMQGVQGATAGGDERKLRGIPVLARGCASAIAGTDPLQALLNKERNSA